MNEISRRLVLRYDPGQYTFRNFDIAATPEELHDLAIYVNAIQEDVADQILMVRVLRLN